MSNFYSAVLGAERSEVWMAERICSFLIFSCLRTSFTLHVTLSDWFFWFLTELLQTAWYRIVVPSAKGVSWPLAVRLIFHGSVRRSDVDECSVCPVALKRGRGALVSTPLVSAALLAHKLDVGSTPPPWDWWLLAGLSLRELRCYLNTLKSAGKFVK